MYYELSYEESMELYKITGHEIGSVELEIDYYFTRYVPSTRWEPAEPSELIINSLAVSRYYNVCGDEVKYDEWMSSIVCDQLDSVLLEEHCWDLKDKDNDF